MSEQIKKLLGDELYNKVLEKSGLKSNEFDLLKNYIPRGRFNEVSDVKKQLEGKVTDYEEQLIETKKLVSNNEEYKDKYNTLETKYNDNMAKKDAEISNIYKRSIVESELIKEGAKHIDLLSHKINLDDLKLENDKLIGITDTILSLKNDYKDMFVEKQTNNNVNKNNNSQNSSNNDDEDWGEVFKKFG